MDGQKAVPMDGQAGQAVSWIYGALVSAALTSGSIAAWVFMTFQTKADAERSHEQLEQQMHRDRQTHEKQTEDLKEWMIRLDEKLDRLLSKPAKR